MLEGLGFWIFWRHSDVLGFRFASNYNGVVFLLMSATAATNLLRIWPQYVPASEDTLKEGPRFQKNATWSRA